MLSSKLKDMHLDNLRNDNRIVEEGRSLQGLITRIGQIEGSNIQTSKIDDLLGNTNDLDAKKIIDAVKKITQEMQLNMVHKDEFLDLRAETGNLLQNMNTQNVSMEAMKQ